ncbi:MAG: hypothetical protein KDC95_02280 [Planctomycetes bacterium]|nr:hypothetical protein [Planctomycetota bacterium]
MVTLGTPPSVPVRLGGVAFKPGDRDAIYVGGNANAGTGAVYRVPVTRDAQNHITAFSGPGVKFADAPNIDGGLQFGPGGVLFFTRYNTHALGMIKPNSASMDKSVSLAISGFKGSVGSLTFIPAGFPNAGQLKLASYNSGNIATATLAPDTSGTFDIASLTVGTSISGGPEGIFYVQPGSPLIQDFKTMAICEYGNGDISFYDIDANGDPLSATRRRFIRGLSGCEGAAIDPLSGDFIFSTFGASNKIVAVRGFGLPCGATQFYGQGLPGSGNKIPVIDHQGCFARRQDIAITTDGTPLAPGAMVVGIAPLSAPVFGGTLLVTPLFLVTHVTNSLGVYSMALQIPDDTNLLNTDFFFQAIYLDSGATQNFSFTRGLKLQVR